MVVQAWQARTLGGDEGGLVGAEERDQVCNLVRLPEPAQGVAGRERSIELRVGLKPGRQPRLYEARACAFHTHQAISWGLLRLRRVELRTKTMLPQNDAAGGSQGGSLATDRRR